LKDIPHSRTVEKGGKFRKVFRRGFDPAPDGGGIVSRSPV
jgi:hypothetical protein